MYLKSPHSFIDSLFVVFNGYIIVMKNLILKITILLGVTPCGLIEFCQICVEIQFFYL